MLRIGHGYDAHKFEHKKSSATIVIGGVSILHDHAILAHSDGDVLVHALCDALLGAIAFGDIGRHFPDTSAEFKNIDSRVLLRKVMQEVVKAGYQVTNADMTIIAQAPKMAPYIDSMRVHLANDMMVAVSQVNIKATTTEKMGFTGRKEGIAAHAVILLHEIN